MTGSPAGPVKDILDGRVALITGGSKGIGFAIAEALVSHGARVTITGRDPAALERARSRLGPQALTASADARVAEEVERAVQATVDGHGGLDVLVNNAGIGVFKNAADMSTAEWHSTIDTNLTGVFYYCRAALPHLRHRGGGWIVNISSLAGKNPFAGGAAYCASKAGLNAFSEALMQEVRYDNIRVSCVMPGSVATEFSGRAGAAGADWKLLAEDVAQVVADLLAHPARSLPSRIEIRPSRPQKS
jgi:NAD(P)-dependent dehydrogenase (short-subunit alcohol dehydrogenase family)